VLKDTLRFTAIARVAPTVRFRALAILLAPFLSRAIDFNVRWSSLDHARRTTFFFLTISVPFFKNRTLITAAFSSQRGVVAYLKQHSLLLA
jgi:hypothetical protein